MARKPKVVFIEGAREGDGGFAVFSMRREKATVIYPQYIKGEEDDVTDNQFEIPQSMRDMAEQNIRQTHAAYEQLTEFMTQGMGSWIGAIPQSPLTAGFKEVQNRAMELATENAEAIFAYAGKISSAKTVQELLALQTQFTQERVMAYVNHTREFYSLLDGLLRNIQHG
ncbi:MAG: phasin family protein [Rhodomicrobium sp.]